MPPTPHTRRSVLGALAATGILPYLPTPTAHADSQKVGVEALERAAAKPVLDRSLLPDPVVRESIKLLKSPSDYIVHVRSKDGAEGISLTNPRAAYLHPIFNQLVAPAFIGRDARNLEGLLWENYRARSN
ncbi:MAG: mandelate racemase/muconate lactonizing enzyme family protein, partial [Planctomycetota bacterium]